MEETMTSPAFTSEPIQNFAEAFISSLEDRSKWTVKYEEGRDAFLYEEEQEKLRVTRYHFPMMIMVCYQKGYEFEYLDIPLLQKMKIWIHLTLHGRRERSEVIRQRKKELLIDAMKLL